MKIIISGGLGYVGGRLSKYFSERGHRVTALSRQASNLPVFTIPENLTILHPDSVSNEPALLHGMDVFIHLAALNENDCVKDPIKAINVNITETVAWLDRAYAAGIRKFIYFSTAHVYDKPLHGYYDEVSLTQPVHPYAITHKCAEDYVLAYAKEKEMSNLVIRLTNSFGGPAFPTADRWTLLVNDLCRSAVKTGKMTLLSDGLQVRDFICLEDVCRGVAHLIDNKITSTGIYNLGAGYSQTVWNMALEVKAVAENIVNKVIILERKQPPAPLPQQQTLTISMDKLKNTGFTLKNNIQEEIAGTLNYFLHND